jgi:hypothetical protein
MQKALEAVECMTADNDCLTERQIDALAMAELAADMRTAEAECIRRGWLDDYRGDGTLEITDAGERYFFAWLASSEHTCH